MEVFIISISRVEIALRITTKSFIHIGSGMGNQMVDRSVMKDRNNLLYIPASSLKGKVRNICEELAQNIKIKFCTPWQKSENCSNSTCIICNIFGSKFKESRLFFDNLYMIDESKKVYEDFKEDFKFLQTQSRTQIMINRYIKTAEPEHLFQSEYGLPVITFQGGIKGIMSFTPDEEDNNISYEIILLIAGLRLLDRIGGNKSIGCGNVQIDIGYIKNGMFQKDYIKFENKERPISEFLNKIENLYYLAV